MAQVVDVEKSKQHYLEFFAGRKTLVMSMNDEEGNPFVSYAPFVKKDGKLYVYLSRLADHYSPMERNETIHVMMRADESETKNHFAMERVRFVCKPANVGDEGYEDVFELFSKAHNAKLIELLRTLDFSLFELTPLSGRYVGGFGQAFDLVDLDATVFRHVVVDKKKEEAKA